jgi:hypothetical protein
VRFLSRYVRDGLLLISTVMTAPRRWCLRNHIEYVPWHDEKQSNARLGSRIWAASRLAHALLPVSRMSMPFSGWWKLIV